MSSSCANSDLVVLSHLRWNFVFQRPQHLMTRYAKHRRVFFVEEPIYDSISTPELKIQKSEEGVIVAVPHLPSATAIGNHHTILATLIDDLIRDNAITDYTLWFYTPMSLPFARHLTPKAILFDVMDELSLFKHAPPILVELEAELFEKADLVFTGGQSLFEAKQNRHSNIHAFPSSIDKAHFAKARQRLPDPADQAAIPHPRIGFFGVIDERTDIELLRQAAQLRPDYQLVMIGPVVKIDPETLPREKNIHYLGQKSYRELPEYVSNWDCAMMPFALNESTRFISPTKTPEFLAAGKPVVSTRIRDVVRPYEEQKLVSIADNADQFVSCIEKAMAEREQDQWPARVDQFLANISWDKTWQNMADLELEVLGQKESSISLFKKETASETLSPVLG